MDESMSAIMAAGYDIAPAAKPEFRPHRTDASNQLAQYYTDDVAEKLYERFRIDFDVFGYSRELSKAGLPPENLDGAAKLGHATAESFLRPVLRAAVDEHHDRYSAALDRLSAVKSDEPEIDAIRGGLLIRLRRYGEALPLLQRVVERADDVANYWLLLGECLAGLKRAKDATDAAERAVAIAPYGDALRSAARVCKFAGDKERAAAYRERMAKIDAWVLLDDEGHEIGKRHKNRVAKHHRRELLSFGGF
jgi:tetratricopeptide (TPR) repeat protein